MFITAFTSATHLSLSWASSIQSIPPYYTSWRSILILSSNLRLSLPSGLFLSGVPTKTLYMPLLLPISSIVVSGPCHHGMASSQYADGGTASNMEGNCDYIE